MSTQTNTIMAALRRGRMDDTSRTLFVKHFSHVTIVADKDHFVVTPVWKDVDRPIVGGISVGSNEKIGKRTQSAMESGSAFCQIEVKTDANGATYISTTDLLMGRTLNADLVKLGF